MALQIQNPYCSRRLQGEGRELVTPLCVGSRGLFHRTPWSGPEGAPTGADLLTVLPSLRPPNFGNPARGTNFKRSWLCRKSRQVSAERQLLAPLEARGRWRAVH